MFEEWDFEGVAFAYYIRAFWCSDTDLADVCVDWVCVIAKDNIAAFFEGFEVLFAFYADALEHKHNNPQNWQGNKVIQAKIPNLFEWVCWEIVKVLVDDSVVGFSFEKVVIFFIGIKNCFHNYPLMTERQETFVTFGR